MSEDGGYDNPVRHHNFKTGKMRHKGYIQVLYPEHPYASSSGYVPEHRVVMEGELGRFLYPPEHVHHINGQRDDNRVENLQVLSKSEYRRLHGYRHHFNIANKGKKFSAEHCKRMSEGIRRHYEQARANDQGKGNLV